MKKDWTIAEMSRIPKCDFCDEQAVYDAACNNQAHDTNGPWAYFCEAHFQTHSIKQLGLGLGQRLVLVGSDA